MTTDNLPERDEAPIMADEDQGAASHAQPEIGTYIEGGIEVAHAALTKAQETGIVPVGLSTKLSYLAGFGTLLIGIGGTLAENELPGVPEWAGPVVIGIGGLIVTVTSHDRMAQARVK